jgi:hypothetical protein
MGSARGEILRSEERIAEDDREEIVEVVRNPSRELPHGFHLLRLAQLFFELATFAHVLKRTRDANDRPLGVALRLPNGANPLSTLERGDELGLDVERLTVVRGCIETRTYDLPKFWRVEAYRIVEGWLCARRHFVRRAHFVQPDDAKLGDLEAPSP